MKPGEYKVQYQRGENWWRWSTATSMKEARRQRAECRRTYPDSDLTIRIIKITITEEIVEVSK